MTKLRKLQKKAPKALKSLDAELKSPPAFRATASGLRMLSFVGGPTRMGGFAPSRSEFEIGAEAFLAAGIRAMVPGVTSAIFRYGLADRERTISRLFSRRRQGKEQGN